MFNVSEVGGLAVAFNTADQASIERALRRLDPGLFLDPEVEPNGPRGPYVYMTVKHHIGSNIPPAPVLEWRDWNGPWPLSMAIVEKVKRRDGGLDGAIKKAVEANERRKAGVVESVGSQTFDAVKETAPSVFGKRSVNLPRSQSLRQSRDRARSRGEKI